LREVLAIEVTAAAVRCLRLAGFGPARRVRAYVERPLPSGLLVPSSSRPNIQNEAAFSRILAEAVGSGRPGRVRLVVPDRSVRIHILNTDALAPHGADLRGFVAWRLRDTLPFEPREARVAFMAAPNGLPNRLMAITLVAREQVVAQYERLIGMLGARVAHVAPAACHLFNLADLEAAGPGAWDHGFLALGIESATLILSRQGVPWYARTFPRPTAAPDGPPAPGPRPPASLREAPSPTVKAELVQEVARTLQHAADEAGLGQPAGLLLAGEMGRDAALAAALQAGLGIPAAVLSPAPSIRGVSNLPSEAHAVLAAALARA